MAKDKKLENTGEAATQETYDRVAPLSADKMVPATITPVDQKRWEYLVIIAGERTDLNPYGIDGWELVTVLTHAFNESTYHFKRPKG
jgi:hypothetical protein